MKNNTMKDMVLPAAVLTIICLIVSAALAFTHNLTQPIIDQAEIERAQAARKELLPEADGFTAVEMEGLPEGVLDVYVADNGMGYVITTTSKGYGGPLKVMTGIKSDGTISAVKITESSETPGLGSKVGEPGYLATYQGQTSELSGVTNIGGATFSSNGLRNAVSTAFEAYAMVGGANEGGSKA